MVLFRDAHDRSLFTSYSLERVLPDGTVRLAEIDAFEGETGVIVDVPFDWFKERFAYKDGKTPTEREHGRCVDVRWEAYADVYVYEDGYEERLYIGD